MEKILHITKRYPPYIGGIETVCKDMVSALRDEYEQVVLAFNDRPETVTEYDGDVKIIRAGVERVIASQPLSRDYKKLLFECMQTFKPDIIHFDYPNPYAAFFLKKALRKFHFVGKFYLFWHMDIIKQKFLRIFFGPQTKSLIKRADKIVVTSPNYLKGTSYLPKVQGKDIQVIPLCVGEGRTNISSSQMEKAKEIQKEHAGHKLVFFFGRHVPYKGLEYLVDAAGMLAKENIDFLIGGSGPLTAELKAKASSLPRVSFLGRIEEENINSYLLACDLFAFPSVSRNEAFGISLAEALYFGKPAVTFTIPGSGVNFVSVDGETGLEAPNRDSAALACNIQKLCVDDALYQKLALGAKGRAKKYYLRETFAQNILASFNSLSSK